MYKNNLYNARKQANKTQAELAKCLEMNSNVYSRYERGDRDIPLSVAVKIADYLNVSLDYIAGRSVSIKGIQADEDMQYINQTFMSAIPQNATNEDIMNMFTQIAREQVEKEIQKLNLTSTTPCNNIPSTETDSNNQSDNK